MPVSLREAREIAKKFNEINNSDMVLTSNPFKVNMGLRRIGRGDIGVDLMDKLKGFDDTNTVFFNPKKVTKYELADMLGHTRNMKDLRLKKLYNMWGLKGKIGKPIERFIARNYKSVRKFL